MHAMTANDIGIDRTNEFARVLDQFAALRTYTSAPGAVGGYRVIRSRSSARYDFRRHAARRIAEFAERARNRLRFSGSLSVVFIGGLALAVLAGPANCPCNVSSVGEFANLSRLGYVQTANLIVAEALPALEESKALPASSIAELLEPAPIPTGTADISTATTGSLREFPALSADELGAARVGRLPTNIEPLSDAPPAEIRLAANSPVAGDLLPILPLAELPGPTSVVAVEIEATPDAEAGDETPHVERVASEHREERRYSGKRVRRLYRSIKQPSVKPASAQPQRYPKWAKQMFDNPWQSQAFSYTR